MLLLVSTASQLCPSSASFRVKCMCHSSQRYCPLRWQTLKHTNTGGHQPHALSPRSWEDPAAPLPRAPRGTGPSKKCPVTTLWLCLSAHMCGLARDMETEKLFVYNRLVPAMEAGQRTVVWLPGFQRSSGLQKN